MFTYDAMFKAGKRCCNGVRWKNSVQRFELHLFSGTAARRREILERKWKPQPYVHFTISERGKTRPIDAPRIQDRQIHKVLTKRALLPLYIPEMIYNNGASLEGKGFEFSRKQLKLELHEHYRRYGQNGYIIEDQSNINNLFRVVELGGTEFPYQADGGVCKVYTAAEIVQIYIAAQTHITTQTTYHNALKSYVQSLTDTDKISSVTYGMTLPKKYRTEMEAKLAVAQSQMEAIVARLSQVATNDAQ